jgi:molybdenum cofactor guanylyltransferase
VTPDLTVHPAPTLSAAILAGGESRRMGRNKAWLEFDGQPLIHLAVAKARSLGAEQVFISGRPGEDFSALDCPVLFDLEPGLGPLGGIERALQACTSSLLLVLAVDLPRMTPAFLRRLTGRCDRLTGAVPKLRGEFEPLVAIYPKRCHALAFQALLQFRLAMRDFVQAGLRERALRTLRVAAADAPCFANWNTPLDVSRGAAA